MMKQFEKKLYRAPNYTNQTSFMRTHHSELVYQLCAPHGNSEFHSFTKSGVCGKILRLPRVVGLQHQYHTDITEDKKTKSSSMPMM